MNVPNFIINYIEVMAMAINETINVFSRNICYIGKHSSSICKLHTVIGKNVLRLQNKIQHTGLVSNRHQINLHISTNIPR